MKSYVDRQFWIIFIYLFIYFCGLRFLAEMMSHGTLVRAWRRLSVQTNPSDKWQVAAYRGVGRLIGVRFASSSHWFVLLFMFIVCFGFGFTTLN